jgi:hypothetical protein
MEAADITVVGMRHLGTLPNLKTMMVYTSGQGDEGMLELRTCTKLEQLVIYDGRITDDAIAELKRHVPNVRVGTNHEDGWRGEAADAERDVDVNDPAPTPDAPAESN